MLVRWTASKARPTGLGSVSRKLDGGTERLATSESEYPQVNTGVESGVGELDANSMSRWRARSFSPNAWAPLKNGSSRSLERESGAGRTWMPAWPTAFSAL